MKRTRLRRGKGFGPRATPMRRSEKRLRMRRAGTPRRPVVTSEERRARRLVKRRSGGVCEIQVSREVCHGRALDFSHRVREGQGGPWSASNGLHACRGCHAWLDANRAAARAKGWSLRSTDPLDGEVMYRNRRRVVLLDDGTMRAPGDNDGWGLGLTGRGLDWGVPAADRGGPPPPPKGGGGVDMSPRRIEIVVRGVDRG